MRLTAPFLIISLLTTQATAQTSDPVTSFEALVRAGTQRVAVAQPVYFNGNRKLWAKRSFAVSDVKYDVRKTDSLVTPIIGLLTFNLATSQTELVPTEQEAAGLTAFAASALAYQVSLRFAHASGEWRFLDGEYQLLGRAGSKFSITPDGLLREPNALPFAAVRLLLP